MVTKNQDIEGNYTGEEREEAYNNLGSNEGFSLQKLLCGVFKLCITNDNIKPEDYL